MDMDVLEDRHGFMDDQSWKELIHLVQTPKEELKAGEAKGLIEAPQLESGGVCELLCHAKVLSGVSSCIRHPAVGQRGSVPKSGNEVLCAYAVHGTELNTYAN